MNSPNTTELALALQGFFHNYLPKLKGMSIHTIHSYRDSLKLLLVFLGHGKRSLLKLSFADIDTGVIIAFLEHLEKDRHNSAGTRNIRLAAIHSFFHYVASAFPQHLLLSQQLLNVPFKRAKTREVEYLEFDEINAVLDKIDTTSLGGRRDYALLVLMFNTGGRVQEIVDLKTCDLSLSQPYSVPFVGQRKKGEDMPYLAEDRTGALSIHGRAKDRSARRAPGFHQPHGNAIDAVWRTLYPCEIHGFGRRDNSKASHQTPSST